MSDRTKPPPGWTLEKWSGEGKPYTCRKAATYTFRRATEAEAISEAWRIHDETTPPAADELTAEDCEWAARRAHEQAEDHEMDGEAYNAKGYEQLAARFEAKARDLKSRAGGGS